MVRVAGSEIGLQARHVASKEHMTSRGIKAVCLSIIASHSSKAFSTSNVLSSVAAPSAVIFEPLFTYIARRHCFLSTNLGTSNLRNIKPLYLGLHIFDHVSGIRPNILWRSRCLMSLVHCNPVTPDQNHH